MFSALSRSQRLIEDSAPPESMLETQVSPFRPILIRFETYYRPSNRSIARQFTPALCAHSPPCPSSPSRFRCALVEAAPSLPSNLMLGAACRAPRRRDVSAFCSAWGLMDPRARPKRLDVMHHVSRSFWSASAKWNGYKCF